MAFEEEEEEEEEEERRKNKTLDEALQRCNGRRSSHYSLHFTT